MYLPFFGLKDNPFKLAFDVNSLFFGRHHEEALAHLRYAVAEGEGFIVITGAKGVGKSTVCRAFLESLKAGATAAFLASPIPGPMELLQRMNRSFGVPADGRSAHELTDALNGFLMQARVAGKKVVVFIDDAQVLEPAVLEQVRLISNLETTHEKLIHIVLIGEPALMQLLNSHALRQMGQRVSVCYEIGPLTAEETAAYIQHRLSIAAAGAPPPRFSRDALREIFRHARGNPRRINIACGAILSAAFKSRQKEISGALAHAVVAELRQLDAGAAGRPAARRFPAWAPAGALLLCLAAAAIFALRPAPPPPPAAGPEAAPEIVGAPAAVEPAAAVSAAPEAPVEAPAGSDSISAGPAPPVAGADSLTPPPEAAAAVPAPAEPQAPPPASPEAVAEAPMTHSVQVGAYLHPDNAQQVATYLAGKGYPARVLKVTDDRGRAWYTVRIGDHPNKRAAQAQAEEFTEREQKQSVVRPFGAY
jgi:general secretion pathway protein A